MSIRLTVNMKVTLFLLAHYDLFLQEQSRTDAQKLIADVTTLVSDCMRRQKEMVSLFVLPLLFYVYF